MTQLLQVVGSEERVQMDSVGLARELVPQMNVAHLLDSGTCFFSRTKLPFRSSKDCVPE
jgi:hypothetical protein